MQIGTHTFILLHSDRNMATGVTCGEKILRHYLHVSGLCSFHSSVHQTFPASHGVEEELCGRQARVEAVGHKAFSSRQLLKNRC